MKPWCAALVLAIAAGAGAVARGSAGQTPQEPTIQERLVDGKAKADVGNFTEAIRAFDDVIRRVNASTLPQAAKQQLLVEAYLNRGIANVGLNEVEAAQADFIQLFGLNPSQTLGTLSAYTAGSKVSGAFEEAKKKVVGTLRLTVKPEDADVQLAGARIDPTAPIALAGGTYTISASRKSFQPTQQQVTVVAGMVLEREIALDRISSTAQVVTVPADVEVFLNDARKGTTPAGPAPAEYTASLAKLSLRPTDGSSRLEITDIPGGVYKLILKKPCYIDKEFAFDATELRDYTFSHAPFVLDKAVGTIRLAGDAGSVFQDGEAKGSTRVLTDVCEGPHRIEVRSPVGRFVTNVDVKRGGELTVTANVRPALAMLALTGEEYRGTDARERLAQAFAASNLTVFTPAPDQIAAGMKSADVSRGWLSTPAAGFTPKARHDVSDRLAKSLDVQAVAEVHVKSNVNYSDVTLTFLARGSSKADTLAFPLDNTRAVQDLVRRLDLIPPLFHNSAGIGVAEVFDGAGAMAVVVVSVEPASAAAQAGVAPGDFVLRINDQAVSSAAGFLKIVAAAKDGDTLAVEMRDRSDAAKTNKRAELKVSTRPAVIGQDDQTLIANRLIMEYRRRLAAARTGLEESVLHLNLGVALMKVESWDDAVEELKLVNLTATPGVSSGTVHYLLGRCYRRLGRLPEEAAAFEQALRVEGAQLVVNGPLITELIRREREAARGR